MEKRGRPKLDPEGSPSKYLTIRVAQREHDTYRQSAERSGKSLSEWIRECLSRAARRKGG